MDVDAGAVMDTAYFGDFAGRDYKFWLPMARVIAAEREGETTLSEMFFNLGQTLASVGGETLIAGAAPISFRQCHALIRNALIGGGVDETEARGLVDTYCFPARPATKDMELAWNILRAAFDGIRVKKNEGEAPDDQSNSIKDA